ncbi:MAG: YlbF family regulator [Clostridiales bacterium]|nr:YlbF family regulator [Clostridiales bacterium]
MEEDMNVYDEAHSLAKAIKESNEFKEFDRMRHEIEKDADANAMIGELQKLQLELQTAQMTGSQPDESVMSRIQSLSAMIGTKPVAAQFMQAQAAFTIMMNDVFGIIGDAVGLK